MTPNNSSPDLDAAEYSLISLVGDGGAQRRPFGHDALWVPAPDRVTRSAAPGAIRAMSSTA
jgi:hypothetical protein